MSMSDQEKNWIRGFCTALAESHRLLLNGNDGRGVCRVAKGAGVTLKLATDAGTNPRDVEELRRAGVE